MKSAANVYKNMSNVGQSTEANPHQLITMLFEGALERLAAAKGAMMHGDIPKKGLMISKAIGIIEGLRANLNLEKGGDIANNLDRLYDYMENRLFEANLKNEVSYLDEVADQLRNLLSGWQGIAQHADVLAAAH
jgi:flagellar protein FliS